MQFSRSNVPRLFLTVLFSLSLLALAAAGLFLWPSGRAEAGPPTPLTKNQARLQMNLPAGPAPALAAEEQAPLQDTGRITGLVLANGVPVSNTQVLLRRYDSNDEFSVMTATTTITGFYEFVNPPTPATGFTYYVRFGPQDDPRYVNVWYGPDIPNYVAGQVRSGGNLNVANVPLLEPPDGATVSFPQTFRWQRRATTTDTYLWVLLDPRTNERVGTAELGYVDSVTIPGVSGLDYGQPYEWYVRIVDTTDTSSFGDSQPNTITFTQQQTGTPTGTVMPGTGTPTGTAVAGTGTPTGTTMPGTGTPTGTPTPGPCLSGTVQVNIQNFAFVPANVTVCTGATVRWTNLDTAPHTSTSDTGVWNSGVLNQGQSFSFTFNTPGVYPYFCAIHPEMRGIITVVQPGTVTPTPTGTITPATGTPTGTVTPMTGTPTGTVTPMTGTPTGTITPATGTPTSTVTPMTGTPTGTVTPMTGTPTGTVTPMTGTPTGTVTPMTGTPTGTVTPMTGTPTGTVTPMTGTPTGTVTPATGTPTGTVTPMTGTPTGTITPATGTPTRTVTPGTGTPTTATVTPPAGTATPFVCTPGAVCNGIVAVRVYMDFGCDGFFNPGTDFPLAGTTVTATLPDGTVRTAVVNQNGDAILTRINLAPDQTVQVSVDEPPVPTWVRQQGYSLTSCPSSFQTRTISASSFGLFDVAFVDFRYGLGQ